MRGAFAKHALVRGLADERDDARLEVSGDSLEPLARAGEVGGAKVARSTRRPASRVRQADPEREELAELAAARAGEA